jgi:hypothetical protein
MAVFRTLVSFCNTIEALMKLIGLEGVVFHRQHASFLGRKDLAITSF